MSVSLDECQQRVLALLPLTIPCNSDPNERVGNGEWLHLVEPVSLQRAFFTAERAFGFGTHLYRLAPGAPQWELITRAQAIDDAVARWHAGVTIQGPADLLAEVERTVLS